jgi:hypothetical protein
MGTIDGSVKWDEVHAHPAFLQYFGITPHYGVRLKDDGSREEYEHRADGDSFIPGRVPVPGCGLSKWVLNEDVPFGVICQQAGAVHFEDNGDHDGDSTVGIVETFEGKLKPVKGISVNPIV